MSIETFRVEMVWRKFFIAVLALFILATGLYVVFQISLTSTAAWGDIINQSGRQRMLSQQILLRSFDLKGAVETQDAAAIKAREQALDDSLSLFTDSHSELKEKAILLRENGQLEAFVDYHYFNDTADSLDQQVLKFSALASQYLKAKSHDAETFTALHDMEHGVMLKNLNAVVQSYQNSSERDSDKLSTASLVGYLLTCLVLMLEVLLIFNPLNSALVNFVRLQRSSAKEMKFANESLAKSAEEYKLMIQQADVAEKLGAFGSWRLNLNTYEVSWSEGVYAIHERPTHKGVPDYENAVNYYSPEDQKNITNHLNRTAENKSRYSYECDLVTESKNIHRVIAIGRYTEINGEPTIVGILQDITETRKQQNKLRQMLDAADDRAKSRSDFLAVVSHEIKTPITGVMGILELLSASELPEEEAKLVRAGVENNKLLMTIVSDILEMSQLNSDRITLLEAPFKPVTVLNDLYNLHQINAQNKGLAFTTHYNGDDCILIGDEQRLKQIMHNLITNAIKYTREGSLDVCLTVGDTDKEDMRAFTITVKDTGIGIPESRLNDLFIPFEQMEDSYRREQGGTGLGLSIAQRITRLMGGRINVDSIEGEGSTFTINLTLKSHNGEAEDVASLEQDVEKDLSHMRILVVEDMPLNRMLLKKMMAEKWGLSVTFAEDGQQALDILKQENFDLIFMDIQMPKLDGLSATKMIRSQLVQHHKTPIYALTANSDKSQIEDYLAGGMAGVIPKPINWEVLKLTIRQVYLDNGEDDLPA